MLVERAWEAALLAAVTFAATNLDTLVLLVALHLDVQTRHEKLVILLSQVVGACIVVSTDVRSPLCSARYSSPASMLRRTPASGTGTNMSSSAAWMSHLPEALIQIVNPTGVRVLKQINLASRIHDSLRGRRVGLLDNNKPNADKFLEFVATRLRERFDNIEFVRQRKMTRTGA